MRMALMTVLFLGITANAEPPIKDISVEMRNSGYTLGDKMDMTVTFSLPVNQSIDQDSLPLVGRVTPWLDIQNIGFSQHQQQVCLQVIWQLFATVEIAQQLETPEIILQTIGEQTQKVVIPAQTFYYSPVLPLPPLKNIQRRQDLIPPLFNTTTPIMNMGVLFSLFACIGFVWLWLKDYLPCLPFQPGPMTRLVRHLRKELTPKNPSFTKQQLRNIHSALNQSAGVSLHPDNLSTLYIAAPYFQAEHENLTQFFKLSWACFYSEEPLEEQLDAYYVLEWLQRVALAERLSKRQHKTVVK